MRTKYKASLFTLFACTFFLLTCASLFGANKKNYVFNLTGTIHGYGDITGPLWTLLKVKEMSPEHEYIAIVDERAEEVITSMYGNNLEAISEELRVKFFRLKDSWNAPIADVSFELFHSGRKIHYMENVRPFTNLVYTDQNTITIGQVWMKCSVLALNCISNLQA
jgi:hypothetical protein